MQRRQRLFRTKSGIDEEGQDAEGVEEGQGLVRPLERLRREERSETTSTPRTRPEIAHRDALEWAMEKAELLQLKKALMSQNEPLKIESGKFAAKKCWRVRNEAAIIPAPARKLAARRPGVPS